MLFPLNFAGVINFFVIASGIGICGLNIMQIRSAKGVQKDVVNYFTIFFSQVITYIAFNLIKELLGGQEGSAVTVALYIVTFIEFTASLFMADLFSLLVLYIASPKNAKAIHNVLRVLFLSYIVALFVAQFFDLFYNFEGNVYQRTPLYLLSNIPHLAMMAIDIYLIIRYRSKFIRRLRIAFWLFLAAPLAGIALQALPFESMGFLSVLSGVHFVIIATVAASVHMYIVIIGGQNERYRERQKEQARLETELNMASSIQADMVPHIFPAYPDRPDFDVYATMEPAKEVGGDFYDFFLIDEDTLALVIADVSGKGIPAALFMMVSKILVQNYAMMNGSPKEVLESVNRQICENNREEMFVTVWLGIVDLKTGKLTASNAGHEYPTLKQKDGSFEIVKDKHGFVIGGMANAKYSQYELQLERGAKIFVYTDGLAEANDENGNQFGMDRLLQALKSVENGSPEEILKGINASVKSFEGGAEQFDDLTMLCFEYKGK